MPAWLPTDKMATTSRVPIAVSRKHLVYSEILRVTSTMRKNSRWASSTQWYTARDSALASSLGLRRTGSSIGQENEGEKREADLMIGFLELKREVREIPSERTTPLVYFLLLLLTIESQMLRTYPSPLSLDLFSPSSNPHPLLDPSLQPLACTSHRRDERTFSHAADTATVSASSFDPSRISLWKREVGSRS